MIRLWIFFGGGRFFLFELKVYQKMQLFCFWDFLYLSLIGIIEPYKSFKKSYRGASYL